MLIRNDREYAQAVERRRHNEAYIEQFRASLVAERYTAEEIETSLAPLWAFHAQLADDIRLYEDARNGKLPEIEDLRFLGKVLVLARIAAGMSQRQLARKLGVSDAVISRDEHNEYQAIAPDRAQRILEALGAAPKLRLRLATDASTVTRSAADAVAAEAPQAETPPDSGELGASDSPYGFKWRLMTASDLSQSSYTPISVAAAQAPSFTFRLAIPGVGAHPLPQTDAAWSEMSWYVSEETPGGNELALGEIGSYDQWKRAEQAQGILGTHPGRSAYSQEVA